MELTPLSLEECIRAYEREVVRKNSLESKASALLNTNAIVVSILNIFAAFVIAKLVTLENFGILIILNIIATLLIGISIYWALDVLRIKKLFIPYEVKDPNLIMKNLDKNRDDLLNDLIDRYIVIIPQIHNFNDSKVDSLQLSRIFLICGLFLSFIGLIMVIYVNGGV